MNNVTELESALDHFNEATRREALGALLQAVEAGDVTLPTPDERHNLHCHTFFSYNAWGYSPSRVAWEARRAGLGMIGTVDFDVLDAMDEAYAAGDLLGLPVSAGLESRVFVPEMADKEINSPGEPGVAYFMGTGFCRLPEPGSSGEAMLRTMRQQADERNRDMIRRINEVTGPVQPEYEADMLTLTPRDNVTERHMLEAYEVKATSLMPDTDERVGYWTKLLNVDACMVRTILEDSPRLRDTIRAKLMKRGGVGYVQPDEHTFPNVDDVIAMILSVGALPTVAWLDGTTSGENDSAALVDLFRKKGCLVMNIIPDRNWNITDPIQREEKVRRFHEMVDVCRQADMPVIVGTEMNKAGQKFVDTFEAPEMAVVADAFHDGAAFLYGHTLMERALGHGRVSAWAKASFQTDAAAVSFYIGMGRGLRAPAPILAQLRTLAPDHTPADALGAIAAC